MELSYQIRIRLKGKDYFFGPGVAELMELVKEKESLSEACRTMGMAYSKGWKIIKKAELELGVPIFQGIRGGAHGGGTRLTPEGEDILIRYRAMEKETKKSLDTIFLTYFEDYKPECLQERTEESV